MKANILIVMLMLAAGCATSQAPQVTYYTGVVTYTSPDGRLPYNKTEALLQREVTGTSVVDTRTEPGNSPSMPPQTTVTRHRREATAGTNGVRIVRQTQGPRPMKVVEEYRPVSQAQYEQELSTMRPPKGSE